MQLSKADTARLEAAASMALHAPITINLDNGAVAVVSPGGRIRIDETEWIPEGYSVPAVPAVPEPPEPPADATMGEGASSSEVPVKTETTNYPPTPMSTLEDGRLRLLEREYASLLLEKRRLEAECENLKAAQSADKRETASLSARITQLEEALESERLTAAQAEEQRANLEAEAGRVRQECSDLQASHASEKNTWEEQAAAQNLALQQAQASSSALETELAAARNELDAARRRVGELEEQTRTVQQVLSEADATREALTACQQELVRVREGNTKLKASNDALAGQLEQARVQVSALTAQLEERTAEVTALETQNADEHEKLADAFRQVEQAQTSLLEKTTALQESEQTLATERDARAAERQELEALRREMEENQARETQEGEQAEAMRLELAQAREEQTRLAQELGERTEYAQTLEADKNRLKRERNTATSQVRDLHTELTAAELALEKAKIRETEQARMLEELQAENKRLNAQLSAGRPADTVSLPVVQRPPTIPPAPAEESLPTGDDKEGDRHGRLLKTLAALVALVLALAAGYLAHLLLTSTDDVADPSPVASSLTATPRSAPPSTSAPATPATPAVPTPPADTTPPAPPVGEGGSAPQGTDDQPVSQPDPPAPVEEPPAPAPAPEPVPVPEPAYVTDLSAGATSSGRSVTISASVSTSGAVPVSVYASVGGRSLSLGSQTVAGSGFFEASISLPPGTYSWSVSADGLVNSGTITVY